MAHKFKVGDTVKCIIARGAEHILTLGKSYNIVQLMGDGDVYVINDKGNKDWFTAERFELLGGKVKTKLKIPKFALQYELDQDPTEYFAELKDAKKRIGELSENASLKRDSILLHTISKTQKVELGVSIKIGRGMGLLRP